MSDPAEMIHQLSEMLRELEEIPYLRKQIADKDAEIERLKAQVLRLGTKALLAEAALPSADARS